MYQLSLPAGGVRHRLLLILPVIGLFSSGIFAQFKPYWSVEMPGIGIYSSPRVADLNADGILDIILGCGKREFIHADTAVIALDGRDGHLLWSVAARDQIFGSACLVDINQDGVMDVVIGGRSAELKAIDGRNGQLIWEFVAETDPKKLARLGYYNFYNPQLIPDQNGDGRPDLIVSNGGDVNAKPYDPARPPGQLFVLDGQNGKIMARAMMPDGKETYFSVVAAPLDPLASDISVVFGTGGETLGGSLYHTSLEAVMRGDLSSARQLATSPDKGFIAPPALVDLNKDGVLDIVVNAVDGRMLAFNGKNDQLLWERKFHNTEAYSSIAPGYFIDTSRIDLFSIYAHGTWPNLQESKQFLLNGADGTILFQDSVGSVQTCSPIAADLNRDGLDEIILSVNVSVIQFLDRQYYSLLFVFDFRHRNTIALTDAVPGVNLAATPWIGDLDGDNNFDIIYSSLTETRDVFAMKGLRINRLKTQIPISRSPVWGTYMGSAYNGVYRPK